MKKIVEKLRFGILGLLIFICCCSLNNPFLPTDDTSWIPVTSVGLQGKKIVYLYTGETYQLLAQVFPDNASDKRVTWQAEDTSIIVVSTDGLVTAIKEGQSNVQVTTVDENKTATVCFIIRARESNYVEPEGIVIVPKPLEITVGEERFLSANLTPDNVTNPTVTWLSSDETIAIVDSLGNVKGIAVGVAKITARTVNGLTDVCDVTVIKQLQPEITLTAPNGGEAFLFGTSTIITWTSVDLDDESELVKLELIDTINDATYTIVASVENSGSYYWPISTSGGYEAGSGYKVRVTSLADSLIYDESNATFTISDIPASIELIAPVNGENFYLATTITTVIKWTSKNLTGKVTLTLIDDVTGITHLIASAIENTGSYTWTLPTTSDCPAGDNYKIRVASTDNDGIYDDSSVKLTLKDPPKKILELTSPNNGEKLYIGTQNDIIWAGVGFEGNVKLELVADDASISDYVIEANTDNDGIYEWTIPEDILAGGFQLNTNYKVRITSLEEPTLTDISDISFKVILAPNIYFVLDDSGSMSSYSRMNILKERMNGAAAALAKNFNIGITAMNKSELLKLEKGWSDTEIKASYESLPASGGTPTGRVLKTIRENKKYELQNDIYNEYRRKAVVVITDGEPASYSEVLQESIKLSYESNVPVFYLGFSMAGSSGINSALETKLQQMAIYGGTDNESDATRNWYPINEDGQFEKAMNQIMYGDLASSNGNVVKLEVACTPDSGNSIYFYGDIPVLGGNLSPTTAYSSYFSLYLATQDKNTGKYYALTRQQTDSFSWGVLQGTSGTIGKKEKTPLHTNSNIAPAFNGWEENMIKIVVATSLGHNMIYYWSCSNASIYPTTTWPGISMTQEGSDYVFYFSNTTSVNLLITNSGGSKLCGNDMTVSSVGNYRVTSSGLSPL